MAEPTLVDKRNVSRVSIDIYNEEMAEYGLSVMDANGNFVVDPEDEFVGASDFEGSLDGVDRVRAMCRMWRPGTEVAYRTLGKENNMGDNAHFHIDDKAQYIIDKNGGDAQMVKDKDATPPENSTLFFKGTGEEGYVVHLVKAGFEFYLDTEYRKEFGGCNYYDFLHITYGILPNNVRIEYRDATGDHKLAYNTKNGKMWEYKWDDDKKRGRWKRMETPKEIAAKKAKIQARQAEKAKKKADKAKPAGKKD